MFSASRRSRHNHLQEEPLCTTAGSLLELLTFSTVENQYGPRPFVLPALPGENIFLRLVLTSLPGRRFTTTSHPSGLTRYPHVHHIDRHTRLWTEIPQHLPALMSRDWTEDPAWTNQRMYSSDRNTQWQRTQQHLEEASTMPPPPRLRPRHRLPLRSDNNPCLSPRASRIRGREGGFLSNAPHECQQRLLTPQSHAIL